MVNDMSKICDENSEIFCKSNENGRNFTQIIWNKSIKYLDLGNHVYVIMLIKTLKSHKTLKNVQRFWSRFLHWNKVFLYNSIHLYESLE